MSKLWVIVLIWFVISFAYIIMAFLMPVVQDLTDITATELQASSNMSNYPGMLDGVNSFPLFAWFIPGVLGIAATVGLLRSDKE